ncbi:GyrI-like domain-containing protein [Lichenihabitans sp. PAMC28606]|uniref:GyrI-like domain-containing protein n=1 Tax=Lichenihabitans sp. PAMC28606 TaxID=2880932 RepID=UPI001D0B19D8|nr:GyrI-like domain-containing protein [Lichenihabitans sp. PAMC28606]UDL94242.1 GyrI-like domain-containing protein [Lichenihabitans sp. PAMC28606]
MGKTTTLQAARLLTSLILAATPIAPALAQSVATPAPASQDTTSAPPAQAQAPATPAVTPPVAPTASTPVAPPAAAAPVSPTTAAPASPAPKTEATSPDKTPPDTSISQTMTLPARPAVVISGKATWDEGFKSITEAFATLNATLAQNKITGAGRPLAVFTETDDSGFKFSAMIPIDKAPEGKTELSPTVSIGETPSGKAMRFQHRGSYDDIDSTYEAITAYLDEKGLEAKNMFAEEYLDQVKTSDDNSLEVDIYVFLK